MLDVSSGSCEAIEDESLCDDIYIFDNAKEKMPEPGATRRCVPGVGGRF